MIGSNARRDYDAVHRFGLIDTCDDMFANSTYVILIVVATDVRYVANALAASENVIETAGIVQIC